MMGTTEREILMGELVQTRHERGQLRRELEECERCREKAGTRGIEVQERAKKAERERDAAVSARKEAVDLIEEISEMQTYKSHDLARVDDMIDIYAKQNCEEFMRKERQDGGGGE